MKKKDQLEEQSNINNKKSAILQRIALCICIVATLLIVGNVIKSMVYANQQKKIMEELKKQVEVQIPEPIMEPISIMAKVPTLSSMTIPVIGKNPYASIFKENEDMVAWIVIPDTKIDLPVMQTMNDETYYLHRDINGDYNTNGTLIMDTDSNAVIPSTNLIIHGHHMKSGEMFGELELYKEEAYAKEHEMISVYFSNCKKEYQVIAVFYSQVYLTTDQIFKYYKFFQADTAEEFDEYYVNIKDLSVFDTEVEAKFGDEFLTLSTCAYQVKDGRFVVVAKKIKDEKLVLETADE